MHCISSFKELDEGISYYRKPQIKCTDLLNVCVLASIGRQPVRSYERPVVGLKASDSLGKTNNERVAKDPEPLRHPNMLAIRRGLSSATEAGVYYVITYTQTLWSVDSSTAACWQWDEGVRTVGQFANYFTIFTFRRSRVLFGLFVLLECEVRYAATTGTNTSSYTL